MKKKERPPAGGGIFEAFMRDACRHTILTREEEREVAQLYKETGNIKYKNVLIEHNQLFVTKIARQYLYTGIPLLDLIQEGNIGLMGSIERFEVDRGFRLCTYAEKAIRDSIRGYVAQHRKNTRHILPVGNFNTTYNPDLTGANHGKQPNTAIEDGGGNVELVFSEQQAWLIAKRWLTSVVTKLCETNPRAAVALVKLKLQEETSQISLAQKMNRSRQSLNNWLRPELESIQAQLRRNPELLELLQGLAEYSSFPPWMMPRVAIEKAIQKSDEQNQGDWAKRKQINYERWTTELRATFPAPSIFSVKQAVEVCGCSDATLRKVLKDLTKKGTTQEQTGTGKHKTTVYSFVDAHSQKENDP